MTNSELYSISVKNKRQLNKALKQINRALNLAIKEEYEEQEYVQIRVLILAWMSYAETNLLFFATKKIFSEAHTEEILSQRNEVAKWHYLLNLIFKIRFLNSRQRLLNRNNLGHKVFHQYETLKRIVDEEVAPFIEVRNRLAHGQWAVCLNGDLSNKNQDLTTDVWKLSKKETLLLKSVLTNFFHILEGLTEGTNDFDALFDKSIRAIDMAQDRYSDGIDGLILDMQARHNRGKKRLALAVIQEAINEI